MKNPKFHVKFLFQFALFIYYFLARVVDIIFSKIFRKEMGFFYKYIYNFSTIYHLTTYELKLVPETEFDYSRIEKFIKSKITILVAGPFVQQHSFTYNSLKYLKRLFPMMKIVLSTDTVLSERDYNSIKNLGVNIILNGKIPTDNNWRIGNLRSQINNISSALDSIDSLPGTYILRIRSDQLISKEDFLYSIAKYFHRYNLGEDKILKISMNSYLNRKFSTSDMFMFSEIGVMKNYWKIDEINLLKIIKYLTDKNMEVFPESIIDTSYFYKVYGYLPSTFDDYIRLIREKFIFIDENNVGIIWQKKIILLNYKLHHNMSEFREITHSVWLDIIDS